MSKGPDDKDTKAEEPAKEEASGESEGLTIVQLLTNIPGVGPRTAEKLAEKGYDSLEKIASEKAEDLAANVPGLSPTKAEGVITETKALIEAIESGVVDISGKKRSKRKKAPEPDPDKHDLPPADEIKRAEERTSLVTGLDKDLESMGIPVAPKWLTRFEKARIIGARALQISMGAPILVDVSSAPKSLFALAEFELKLGVLPMTVRRTRPTGESHDIPLSTLLKSTRLD